MKAIKEIEIHISEKLLLYFRDRFRHGEHDQDTLNGLAEGCEYPELIMQIDDLIRAYGDVTIRKCDL